MARSFSNTKLLSAFIVDQISIVLTRRGYATSAGGAVSGSKRVGAMSNMMLKKGKEEGNKTTSTTSWVPDPKTGVYRPENHGSNADAAELRELLLANKINRHSKNDYLGRHGPQAKKQRKNEKPSSLLFKDMQCNL